MKKLLISHASLFLFVFIILLQLATHVYIYLRPAANAPPGHVAIVHSDDSYYVSEIRQIKQGGWTFTEPHTTRPIPSVIVYALYIIGGKIAALFSVDPVLMYSILRITGSLAASIATYLLIIKLLPKSLHVLGVLFTFFVETAPAVSDIFTKPFNLWVAAATNRVIMAHQFEAAHHRWGEACAVTLLILFLSVKPRLSFKYIIAVILLTILGTLFSPSNLLVFSLAIYIPYAIADFIRNRNFGRILPIMITLGVIGILGIWMKYEFAKGPPLNTFNESENSWFPDSLILSLYSQATLLYIPWILLFIASGKRKAISLSNTAIPLLMVAWIGLPALLIWAKPNIPTALLPFANWRIAWGVPTIPFAILAALGAETLRKLFWHKRIIANVLIAVFFSLSFLLSVQFTKNFMDARDYAHYPVMYPSVDIRKSFQFLDTLPRLSGIMTAPTYGEFITVYAGVRVFIGPTFNYVDWLERRGLTYNFFSGAMTTATAAEFLKNNDISYIFFGPEERSYDSSGTPLFPSLLKTIYDGPDVTIYQVLAAKPPDISTQPN